MALPMALLLLVGLGFVATASAILSNTDQRVSVAYGAANGALASAEAALEHGIVELSARTAAGQDPDGVQIVADTLATFTYTVTANSKREGYSVRLSWEHRVL
ncbi:MAG: hypothetical protein H0V09_10380 [Gemmatimonadetes bacterium]|nr:hypothetical protein [Gemmatimonadota bacterium]